MAVSEHKPAKMTKAEPQGLTLAQFRLQRLAAVSKPLWHIVLGIHVAAILRSTLTGMISSRGVMETTLEVATIASYLVLHVLPVVVVNSGRLALLQPVCAAMHLVQSVGAVCMGLGVIPDSETLSIFLRLRVELVLEAAFTVQGQMSPSIMAVLHAVRQAGWMTILVCCVHGDPYHALLRGVFNWVVMMGLSGLFEWRTRSLYRKLCSTQQQQQQQENQPSLPRPVPSLPLIDGASEFTSHLPDPVKPPKGEGSTTCQASTTRQELPGPVKPTSEEAGCSPPHQATGAGSASRQGSGSTPSSERVPNPDTDGCRALAGVKGTEHSEDHSARSDHPSADENTSSKRPPAGAGSAAPQLPVEGSSSSSQAALMQRTQHILTHRYASCLPMTRVFIKVQGVEVKDMPPGAPALLQQRLQASMPRVLLAGMSVRSGCIVMTLDLRCDLGAARSEEGEACDDVTLPDGMVDLVTHLTRSSTMGQMLGEGDTMCIQTPTGLVSCQWDGASESYRVVDTTGSTALTFPAHAAACRLLTASPAVHTLPDSPPALVAGPDPSPAAAGCHQLKLAVQLQLPRDCRLVGWQPAAAALPDRPGGSAMLLARRMGGGYLPVTVERVSCVVGPGGDEAGMRHTAEVVVEMDGEAPALLCLELWYKQQPTQMAAAGSELLVSHVPLLVLPSSWQAAAVQLQQHMDHMGGVQPRQAYPAVVADPPSDAACCLLEDLGIWLTHHCSYDTTTSAVPPTLMSRLHDELLSHAVLHGLGDVAELMVTTLQRGEQQTAHSTWLQRATSGAPGAMSAADGDGSSAGGSPMPLLHAAMASGQPTMLEQVLRWGSAYGGPAWAWPWELEYGEQGCTALHLAAAQPACPALLETITRTLPPGQVQAARSVWLHGRGGVGASPAEVFALAFPSGSVGDVWASHGVLVTRSSSAAISSDVAAAGEYCTAASRTTVSSEATSSGSNVCRRGGRAQAADDMSSSGKAAPFSQLQAAAAAAPSSIQPSVMPQSWLGSVIEVWTTRETDEYRAWARRQMSSLVSSWAATMVLIYVMAVIRSYKAGCGFYEAPHLTLHTLPYMLMAAAASGNTWLGDWQAWMLPAHAFHSLGYLAKTYVPSGKAFVWASATGAQNFVYVVVLGAVLDQTSLPLLLVARTVEAYCQSLAYASVGVLHPLRQALLVHACALAVSTLCRVWQLRAFRRWQAAQQRSKQIKPKSA